MEHNSITEVLKDIQIETETRAPQQNIPAPENKGSESESKAAPAESAKDEGTEVTKEMIEGGADLAIFTFDVAQEKIFRFLVKKRKNKKILKLYGESALDKLEALLNEQDAATNKLHIVDLRKFTAEEQGMLRIAKAASEVADGLPLTDDEKDLIRVPLIQIMQRKGGTLPPEYALMLGLLTIAGARTGEIFMI